MKITTKITIAIETGKILEHHWYEYSGIVALCKGDSTASSTEQAQAAFTNTLQAAFQQQFAGQQQILSGLTSFLTNQMNNPTGMSPQALAAARTQATDTIAQETANTQQAAQMQNPNTTGLPTGVQAQVQGQIQAAGMGQNQTAPTNISLENAQLQNQNMWNAVTGLGQVASLQNPTGYAGAASGAAQTVGGLSQAVTASQQSPLLGAVLGAAGGIATGAGNAGGFGQLFGLGGSSSNNS